MRLDNEWKQRQELLDQGRKLYTEADKLYTQGPELRTQGDAFYADGRALHAEADVLFKEAVTKTYGDIKVEWMYGDGGWDCHLGNGEVYKWEAVEVTK